MHRLCAAFAMLATCTIAQAGGSYGLGQPATGSAIRAWDIDVRADGTGLPQGRGSVSQGEHVYAEKCAACHGDRGQGKPMDRLVGDHASLTGAAPVKTVGSYWPFATTLFDYVRRAMPFNAPRTLSGDETYAVVAYVLHLNGVLGVDGALDAASLPRVQMPNRNGFVGDPRPDVHAEPCESDCR